MCTKIKHTETQSPILAIYLQPIRREIRLGTAGGHHFGNLSPTQAPFLDTSSETSVRAIEVIMDMGLNWLRKRDPIPIKNPNQKDHDQAA